MILEPFDNTMLVRPLPEPPAAIPHISVSPKLAEAIALVEVVVPPTDVASCATTMRAHAAIAHVSEGEDWKRERRVATFAPGDVLLVASGRGYVAIRVDGVEHWVLHASLAIARVSR